MKQTYTQRDKGRAVFLAALMVLSVFAMTVSFTGAAAAQVDSEPNAQFDQSTYSEEAGDIAEITVELENTDSAQIELVEVNDNYNVTLDVTDADGDGEVTVYLNTYLAGEDNDAAFYTADDSDDTVSVTVNEDNTGDSRLLPADFDLQLFIGEGEDREEVDVAALFLTEGSIGNVATGTAPSDADLSDVESIADATTASDEIAEGDNVIVAFEAYGVFGAIDVGEFEDHFNLVLDRTSDAYDGEELIEGEDYELVEDPENDRFFVILNTDDMEAGDEFELSLEPATDDDGAIDSLYFINGEEYKKGSGVIVSTEFSIVERAIEVTGDFDKEDRLLVENSGEAVITGESNAAPGTDVRVQLRATGEDPFLMTQTVEVQADGSIEAEFDLSEHQAGQEFTVTMTDQNDTEVEDQVNAILVESTDGEKGDDKKDSDDHYSGDKKSDDKQDDKKSDDKQDDDRHSDDKKSDDKQDNGDDNGDDNNEQPGSGADEQPGFGIAVALVALLAAAGFALRRQ